MPLRRKTVRAGALVTRVLYTAPCKTDNRKQRAAKREISSRARQATNLKQSKFRLENLLAANFPTGSLFLTGTFDRKHRCTCREETAGCVRRFLRNLRDRLHRRGLSLSYIYALHQGERGNNWHAHIVLRPDGLTLPELVKLWKFGNLDCRTIGDGREGDYQAVSNYLVHEADQREHGQQCWTSSKGLRQPEVEIEDVPADTTLRVPLNAFVLVRETFETAFGRFCLLKYIEAPADLE